MRFGEGMTICLKFRFFPAAMLLATTAFYIAAAAAPETKTPPLRLRTLAEVPLGGHPTRLDYASVDTGRHLLFIAHLGDSEVIVVDTQARRVIKRIPDISKVHGVPAIPELNRVYASATGTNEVVAIDEKALEVLARMPGGTYPDGLAYAPDVHKVYVSDEHGGTDTVVDVISNTRVATIQIGGVIGNTQYDASSRHIFINAQSTNELVEVDPASDSIVRRIAIPGSKGNHGLLIDPASHRAFIACEGNDRFIALDLRSGKTLAQFPVAKDPDVLAFDPHLQFLYVAGESGEVSEFNVARETVVKTGESVLAPNAHVVAIDPTAHEIYFPLMNVNGKPVLRIMRRQGDTPEN
jgi:DNA-binding beta-propeller fold protein YncE